MGFYGLTTTVDLLPLFLNENLGIVGWLFRDWEFWIEGGSASHRSINRGRFVGENHLSSSSKNSCFKTLISFLATPPCRPFFFSSNEGKRRRGRKMRRYWLCLSFGEFGKCITLVIIKGLLRHISHLDMVPPWEGMWYHHLLVSYKPQSCWTPLPHSLRDSYESDSFFFQVWGGWCTGQRGEGLLQEKPLFLWRNPPIVFSLISGSSDSGMSDEMVPSERHSPTSKSLLL